MATMRRVSIKKLRDNLSKELKDLPIAITSDSQVVATILKPDIYNRLVGEYKPDSSHKLDTFNTLKQKYDIRQGNSHSIYDPIIHKAGDRVLVQSPYSKKKKLIEMIVPELDAGGQKIYE